MVTRGSRKKNAAASTRVKNATTTEVTIRERCSRRAGAVPAASGAVRADSALRLISKLMNVETLTTRKRKKKARKSVSTVRVAAARISMKAMRASHR